MNTIFLKPSDPCLRKVAEKVSESQLNSTEIRDLAQTMLKIIKDEQKGHKKGVGLAAPQIGILKRIILVDVSANGKGRIGDLKVFINPEIIWKSKTEKEWYEGCYSTGNVYGIVSRPTSIKIQGYPVKVAPRLRLNLNIVEERWTGYVARIFQHEIDHLDGKVFVDKITDPDKLHWVLKKEFAAYRSQQAWRNWPKKAILNMLK